MIEIVHTVKGKFQFEGVSPKGDVLELCRKRKGDIQYWCSCNGVTTRGDGQMAEINAVQAKQIRNNILGLLKETEVKK